MSIDLDDAREAPGVLALFTASDLAELKPIPHACVGIPDPMRQVILASDRVRHVGQAVVAVVAETLPEAVDAAELVLVEYEPLAVVVEVEASVRNDDLVFPDAGTNHGLEFASRDRADFSGCEVVVEERIVNQRLSGAPIEARVGAAYWTDDGRLVHYSSCQGAHPTKAMLSTIYGLPPGAVDRVAHRELPRYAAGARAGAVRQDRWHPRRADHLLPARRGARRRRLPDDRFDPARHDDAHGMRVLRHHQTSASPARRRLPNKVPITAYRGAGRPEAGVAVERMVDRFAIEIGMDPAEVRRIHLIPRFTDAFTTGIGTRYDVGDFPESLERALRQADDELRAEQERRRIAGDAEQLGIGIATYVEITAGVGGSAFGSVELQPDGSLVVRSGATAFGQGHVTTWAMLVADRTGVAINQITVLHGDTDQIRTGGITVGGHGRGSRSRRRPRLRGVDAHLSFGTHVAVVEVDPEAGQTRLVRLIACDDAGNLLNPLLADGQVHGGIAQGVAQALMEEFGGIPSVYNAIIGAVSHLGVRHLTMPCTPEKVWVAIREADSA